MIKVVTSGYALICWLMLPSSCFVNISFTVDACRFSVMALKSVLVVKLNVKPKPNPNLETSLFSTLTSFRVFRRRI